MASDLIYLDNDQFNRLASKMHLNPNVVKYIRWDAANTIFAKKVETLYELNIAYAEGDQSLRVDQWPEGHVVWANGKIIFKSWET